MGKSKCNRCGKPFRADFEDGMKLLDGTLVHIWCRTAEEQLECMLSMTLEDANELCKEIEETE